MNLVAARRYVLQHLRQQIRSQIDETQIHWRRHRPEMVVRIDDWQLWLHHWLGVFRSQPYSVCPRQKSKKYFLPAWEILTNSEIILPAALVCKRNGLG